MIKLIIISLFIASGAASLAILSERKKKPGRYCGLYKDQQLLDSGYCSDDIDCDKCPHLKRIV